MVLIVSNQLLEMVHFILFKVLSQSFRILAIDHCLSSLQFQESYAYVEGNAREVLVVVLFPRNLLHSNKGIKVKD